MDLPSPVRTLEEQVAALRTGAGLRRLESLAVLSVHGRDRASWLNGMVTNDVRSVPVGASVYAAIVGVKGKLLTDVYVHGGAESLDIVLPRERVEEVSAHFDRYIVMEDVTLSPRENVVFTLQGPKAREAAKPLGAHSVADRLTRGGVDFLVAPDALDAWLARVREAIDAGTVTVVSPEAWEVARIELGVPQYGVDFEGSNFVQEATITPRAVSFQKGCYLGQEVVCRLQMRGQVQKHLVGVVVEGDPPAPGETLTEGDKPVGTITSAARSVSLPGKSVALAMVRRAVIEASPTVALGGRVATLAAHPAP